MLTENVLRALIAVWPDLPELVGPAWPVVLERVRSYAAALQDGRDPLERTRLSSDLWLTFRDYAAAKPRLQEALVTAGANVNQRRSLSNDAAPDSTRQRDWSDLLVELQQRVNSAPHPPGSDFGAPDAQRREVTVTGCDLDGAPVVHFTAGQTYLLRFGVASPTPGNLASGNTSVDDVPQGGIRTRWVVTSMDVELLPEQSTCTVQKVAGTWRAQFDLFIPEKGRSETRQLGVMTPAVPGSLLATIYIVSDRGGLDFYREVAVSLTDAPVVTADESWKAAQHTHVRTTHEWTTPPEHIQISIKHSLADVSTKRVRLEDYAFTETYSATDNLLSGPIENVRASLEKFREIHEDYLDDLDYGDMGRRLAQPSWQPHPYNVNGWQALPDQADGPHKSAFAIVQQSQEWRDLAADGYALFDRCFPQGGMLRTLLNKLLPGSRIDFLWTDQSGPGWVSHVPWALMYMEPVDVSGRVPADPEKFLGLRFRIASRAWSVNNGSVVLGGKDAVHALHLLYWGRKPGDDVAAEAQWQADEYGKMTESTLLPDTARPDLKQQIVSALDSPGPSPTAVLYFYCHCSVGDGTQWCLRFGNTSKREDILTRADLSQRSIPDAPLVFANACSTAQADPHKTSELEVSFFKRGARAFIGSEAKVPIRLASKFAWLYFQYFFRRVDPDPMAAGEALTQARIFLWTQYQNVGGLFYSLTNQYDLYLASNEEVLALRR